MENENPSRAQRINAPLIERIAEKLKAIRKERELTQENVRFDLDVNIGWIEAGIQGISITTLGKLCDYYHISLAEFFEGIETK